MMMIMKSLLCFAALIAVAAIVVVSAGGPLDDLSMFNYKPLALSQAEVISGSARFQILTPWVIRMEYSAKQAFEDRATLAIVNRNTGEVPQFTHSTSNGVLTIQTEQLKLTYKVGSGAFNGGNLQISSLRGAFKEYSYGDKDTQNLLGTIRSLDDHCAIPLNCDDNKDIQTNGENLHCAWGMVSRGGWTVINDTANFIMGQGEGTWFSNTDRGVSDMDMYFFGHGTLFKQALKDFVLLGGKVPIPSRPLLGSWFTRWFDYDHSDLVRLLDIFVKESIPLDVLVLDMNWHTKYEWTGWTWDWELYPYPNSTLEMIRKRGLMTAANVHDAQGVDSDTAASSWDAFCARMGMSPTAGAPIMFQPLNGTYMRAVEDVLLLTAAFDYYWTDWQQGGTNGGCNGYQLNPTFITDHVRWSDNMRRGVNKRSNNFARFGGLGAHRYPVGFTGDVDALSWKCFAYQPYFSVTASNVAFGYPSHDLVGPYNDHELHVRWMQFGAFSGVMRIHDRGMSSGACWDLGVCAIVDIWTLPYKYFSAIRSAMTARVELLPYTYREARRAFDTGLNFVHGLYYEFPTHNNAYDLGPSGTHAEYFFGEDIVVNVITSAANAGTELVTLNLWVPPGTWYDNVFGSLETGPKTITKEFALGDIPMFIRAGAVIPRLPHAHRQGIAAKPFAEIDWWIYPGASTGSTELYEDDAMSWDYIRGQAAWTNASYMRPTQTSIHVAVGPAKGPFAGSVPVKRRQRFMLVAMAPVTKATCNGMDISYDQDGGAGRWHYDGFNAHVVIDCGDAPTNTELVLTASFVTGDANGTPLLQAKGYASRTMLAKHIMDNRQKTPGTHNFKIGYTKLAGSHPAKIMGMASTCDAAQFNAVTGSNYQTVVQNAANELNGQPAPPTAPPAPMYALVQLFDKSRGDMVLCGAIECLSDNYYYEVMWLEGYQATPSDNNAVKFYDYWNFVDNDNWADTNSKTPDGYTNANFANGHVLKAAGPNTQSTCLQVWWNANIKDHMTVSTTQGVSYAKENGYTLVENCIGYTLKNVPSSSSSSSSSSANGEGGCAVANAYRELVGAANANKNEKMIITAQDLLDHIHNKNAGGGMPPRMQNSPRKPRNHLLPARLRHQQMKKQQQQQPPNVGEDSATQRAVALLQSALS